MYILFGQCFWYNYLAKSAKQQWALKNGMHLQNYQCKT